MKHSRWVVLSGGLGILGGGLIFGLLPASRLGQGSLPPTILVDSSSWVMHPPVPIEEVPEEELVAATDAYMNGDPLPPGYTSEFRGDVEAILTGVANIATGEREVIVKVVDDQADLDELTVEFNDTVIGTADRMNGGVVDRGSTSKATLSVWLPDPASTNPYAVTIRWIGLANGSEREYTYTR